MLGKINVMDKIWDRKSFKVGGHWQLWLGWKKRMTMQNRQKSNTKKKFLNAHIYRWSFLYSAPTFASRRSNIYRSICKRKCHWIIIKK